MAHYRVPSNMKFFIWRLARHSMSTADLLQHRNMSTTHLCVMCGCEDSWRHALLNCTMSRCIWTLAENSLTEAMSQNEDPNAKNWIFAMNDILSQKDFVLLVVTLWAVWKARRKAIYEGVFQSPQATYQFIQSYLANLKTTKEPVTERARTHLASRAQWIPPPENFQKINVDAAVGRGRKHGAVAARSRDCAGQFLGHRLWSSGAYPIQRHSNAWRSGRH